MIKFLKYQFTFILTLISIQTTMAQDYWSRITGKPSVLELEKGFLTYKTPDFRLKLVKSSQTVAALSPASVPDFDFTPGDRLNIRDKDSLYHLGDINLRIRQAGGAWKSYSTAAKRSAVQPLNTSGNILAAADLSATLPKDIPVSVKRYYETAGKNLVMRFEITNTSSEDVEIGALGIPMIFNNILEGKSLDEAHAQNVFFDPYTGLEAGYLEVKRLHGNGPDLLVIPGEHMSFEAYRPLLDDPTPRSIVFEGFHEWMAHSRAYAENEWKGAEQWNVPTSVTLRPGDSRNYTLKFVLADDIRKVPDVLAEQSRPVVTGIPGYVIPMDVKAHLFLRYTEDVDSFKVEPEGALELETERTTSKGAQKYAVYGKKWGRARLTVRYKDGLRQTIHYKIIKPESEVVEDFGRFLLTEQWFDGKNDPFHRNPSVISYDYEEKKQVSQDSRAWIAGLSDEGGAGSWLGAVMKQLIQPDKEELEKLQRFVDETLWGTIQHSDGPRKYGVKKSVFYYEPEQMPEGTYDKNIDYTTWAAWNREGADDVGRSYNYPHVAAAYWVMYRLSRYRTGLVSGRKWDWYLKNAYHTTVAMTKLAPHYAQFGQMEGTVFLLILEDLYREGLTEMADDLEARMRARAEHWKGLSYPFGSEMPWDSTGQEEVYAWSDYFGFDKKALVTLNAILAYMPVIPHWAYNGNARRYWDFLYGGKLSRVERQIHHYGSGLNAIPVLTQFRKAPEDLYLLKTGYGGLLGAISNITRDGFGPAAFHSFPSTLQIDGLSGDYGSGFFGYAVNTATYITRDDDMGWLAFGGNVIAEGKQTEVEITTAARNRVYIAPGKLWLTLDAGTFKKVRYNLKSGQVEITLDPKDKFTPVAYLRIDGADKKLPYKRVRGAYAIKLKKQEIQIKI
ncbi:DUF5695 domain-containing protein [Sinomicrobium weinanense]|uniref:Uncharacterized protein n=1 Tax=Sinomicrobium weinanense TaxID=2842200 RepID=A0A926Q409_9FLAO|nr:DUF5695 domain-containing protein [Sinomicrobium weinanense]MBC9796345.1 hypothetical protein [Sinomicrobium weinanense]MBU3122453.1 hypothetical protein [Sinomicrobium weinanense]